jgi:hypothetical protein
VPWRSRTDRRGSSARPLAREVGLLLRSVSERLAPERVLPLRVLVLRERCEGDSPGLCRGVGRMTFRSSTGAVRSGSGAPSVSSSRLAGHDGQGGTRGHVQPAAPDVSNDVARPSLALDGCKPAFPQARADSSGSNDHRHHLLRHPAHVVLCERRLRPRPWSAHGRPRRRGRRLLLPPLAQQQSRGQQPDCSASCVARRSPGEPSVVRRAHALAMQSAIRSPDDAAQSKAPIKLATASGGCAECSLLVEPVGSGDQSIKG